MNEQRVSRYALTMTLAAALLGWMFDGFEMGLFPACGKARVNGIDGAAGEQNYRHMVFGHNRNVPRWCCVRRLFFGWLGDRIGRVRALVWSVATYSVFSGLCGFATAPWHLAVLRFIGIARYGRRVGAGSRACDGGVAFVFETDAGGAYRRGFKRGISSDCVDGAGPGKNDWQHRFIFHFYWYARGMEKRLVIQFGMEIALIPRGDAGDFDFFYSDCSSRNRLAGNRQQRNRQETAFRIFSKAAWQNRRLKGQSWGRLYFWERGVRRSGCLPGRTN